MTASMPDPEWVNSNDQLASLAVRWLRCDAVAVDTEFVRTQTFYANPGLIQVSDGEEVWLLDPIAIDDFTPLIKLFTSASVVKVFHSCSEDLELLMRLVGVAPRPLFDSQLAAAFAGIGFSMGYQRLVSELVQLDLPKDETRSNWCHRPLTNSQLHYAALDVYYLMQVYRLLVKRLQGSEKLQWVLEEGNSLADNAETPVVIEDYYRQVKVAWKLFPDQLAVLRSLCTWREEQARERNLPRNRVARDSLLWDMAKFLPTSLNQLKRTPDIPQDLLRRSGNELLQRVKAALDDKGSYPSRLPFPLPPGAKPVVKRVREFAGQKAENLGIEPEIMVKKKQIDALVQGALNPGQRFTLPASLSGWRATAYANELVDTLNQEFKS
ncbi:ribonuclease D [Aestuariirhabdus sp. Z084]|uniref:ribonuclease D n=1 Tax=Aestuariirhabdus haliotis TaxID=2918751 RepID=UPI00201B40CB|nr:ribonuclease D [Aestuariirhabdus haliotis]MCL6416902.1 ribonuclease D [Aestuariirhabdus haliotis]MCL6420879.1 ribonuclease D [Aestuariirhabdus haliotis]